MSHVLSIVIPTKNRAVYCHSTVKSILNYSENLQLIVQDSSDGSDLQERLSDITDARFFYNKVSADLNMTENFDSALRLATGDYVLMLGDDDGISPQIFDAVDTCVRMNADSITSREFYAAYNWPDFRSKYSGDFQAGKLSMNLKFDSSVTEIDMSTEIGNFLNNAGQGCMALPRIYHGLISQSMIKNIRNLHGACFFGVSPDVSFAFLAAVHSRRHLVANFPITIAGASGGSNAGRSALRTHKGELWADPHMKHYKNEVWPSVIPEFFSVESVWAQAALAAVDLEPASYRARFNFAYLYALMFMRHRDQRSQTSKAISAYLTTSGKSSLKLRLDIYASMTVLAIMIARDVFRSVIVRFTRSKNNTTPALDIESASAILKLTLQTKK